MGSGNVLTVSSTGLGHTTITVTASDVNTSTNASFDITCRDASTAVDLYPVPVKKDGVLNIRMGDEVNGNVQVNIYSMSGTRVFDKVLEMADGIAQTIDISALQTGNYRVVIRYRNEEITRKITKL